MSSPTSLPPITPVTADEPEAMSADPVAANVQALKALFPDAFSEGGVDFDTLRQLLGDAVDDGEEKYGLNWSGKRRARRLALTPSLGTLLPAPEDSVEWDTTKNLMIEGDNLEVLKLLQKSYAGKVKLIYIDPPYNTGNDFVYPDDYKDSLGNYLRRTNQVGNEGVRNTTNTEGSGRYHTDWLSMMFPRLMLARQLLRDDGLIFISMGENEIANLKLLGDFVFGEECHVGTIARVTGTPTGGGNQALVGEIDYLLVLSKQPDAVIEGISFSEEDAAIYDRSDEKGRFLTRTLRRTGGEDRREDRPSMFYGMEAPDGSLVFPYGPTGYESRWICGQDRYKEMAAQGLIEWIRRERDGGVEWQVHQKYYAEGRKKQPSNFWSKIDGNKKGTRELRALFEGEKIFDNPKPVGLISHILSVSGVNDDAIVLDFFAGSGTTGHAVMAQNAADGGDRRYIVVQLPEPLDPENKDQKTAADFCDSIGKPRTIAELTKERLRRAGAKVKADNPDTTADLGFRAYKLATSNLKAWAPGDDLEADLLAGADNLAPGRTEDHLLVELLLKRGIDLAEPSQTREIAGRTVHAFGGGVMLACLGDVKVADAEALADGMADWVEELAPVAPAMIFFKDAGFENDVAKTNVAKILDQRLNGRGPGEAHLLEAVRSV
jgi:adenine-specific DNA-methyltransferase